MMGSRVSIPSGKRQHFGDDRGLTATTRFDTVEVGEGTWVGEAATIMANVGEGCVVSAGAVVARDMPAHSIVGGNPARVLKSLRASAEPADAERSADI
jgi:acetyltransferase-like isoleucine patch superfamily enzyme